MGESSRYLRSSMPNSDATDRILDNMDAQLNGVSRLAYNMTSDVNDDPGTDIESIRAFRTSIQLHKHKDIESQPRSYTKASNGTAPENKGYLHKLYDNDINLLRELLKQNIANEEEEFEGGEKQVLNGDSSSHSPHNSVLNRSNGDHSSVVDQQMIKSKSSPSSLRSGEIIHEPSPCSCGCEKEMDNILKERDELRARVRRGEASRTTIEERKELERALHSTKSALFQERKKSRQQIEDLQDKLEEMEHHYEEVMGGRGTMNGEVTSIKVVEKEENPNISALKDNLRSARVELKISQESLKTLHANFDRLRMENVDLKHQMDKLTSQDGEKELDKLSLENKKLRERLDKVDRELIEERKKFDEEVHLLHQEKERLNEHVMQLSQKSRELCKDVEEKERKILEEQTYKERGLNQQNKSLNDKLECLNGKLSALYTEKLGMEKDLENIELKREEEKKVRDENEEKLRTENKEILSNVESLQLELAHVISKAKDLSVEFEHKEHCFTNTISDVCHKLSLLHRNMRPLSSDLRSFTFPASQSACKKSLAELTEISELVSRAGNEILSEVVRLRRDARKRPDFMSTLRSNSDASIASEEVKMLRTKLTDKDNELQHLQKTMNEWKDSTTQRLAKKFQEELNLQVERKISQQRNDQLRQMLNGTKTPDPPTYQHKPANPTNGTSTVKLLCHLQGRVKQLRTENDLLRSSSFISELTDHRNHEG